MDPVGIYGTVFHYAALIFFFGSAVVIFIYLWKKGRLDMDEAPKYEMMEEDKKEKDSDE